MGLEGEGEAQHSGGRGGGKAKTREGGERGRGRAPASTETRHSVRVYVYGCLWSFAENIIASLTIIVLDYFERYGHSKIALWRSLEAQIATTQDTRKGRNGMARLLLC